MNETEKAVFETVVNEETAVSDPDLVTLANGVVLKVHGFPLLLMTDLEKKLNKSKPKPPILFDENKGRSYPNPDDPDYLDSLKTFENEKGMAQARVMIGSGTTLVSVPEGMESYEDSSWLELAEYYLDEQLGTVSGRKRYLLWLQYYAITTESDIQELAKLVAKKIGVAEEDVITAIQRFPGNSERGADRGSGDQD